MFDLRSYGKEGEVEKKEEKEKEIKTGLFLSLSSFSPICLQERSKNVPQTTYLLGNKVK